MIRLLEHPVVPGRVYLCERKGDAACRYYLWRHPQQHPGSPWLVAVHGINRDAREQVALLREVAARTGVSLVAPLYDEQNFPRYQRLGVGGGERRADLALLGILADVEARFGAATPFNLFGFSGGAQFAHRFALAHPQRVRRLVVAAAGWYTMPAPERAYPYGTRTRSERHEPVLQLERFLQIPTLVLVGSRDCERDRALRKRKHLDRDQGRHRLARAQTWVAALRESARSHGAPAGNFRLDLLDEIGHSFADAVCNGELDGKTFDFLLA